MVIKLNPPALMESPGTPEATSGIPQGLTSFSKEELIFQRTLL
jgi:hypothetical protein